MECHLHRRWTAREPGQYLVVHRIILFCITIIAFQCHWLPSATQMIQVSTCGHNPYSSNLRSNLRWETFSKAFEKCKNKQVTSSSLFNAFAKSFMSYISLFHNIYTAESHAVLHKPGCELSSGLILMNKLYVQGVWSTHMLVRWACSYLGIYGLLFLWAGTMMAYFLCDVWWEFPLVKGSLKT